MATRRNPDDTMEMVLLIGLLGVGGWAVWKQMQGLKAIGQGIGGAASAAGAGAGAALGATGQAAGQTASAVGTSAHDAVTGVGNFFSGVGAAVQGRLATGSEATLAAQWRVAAAANAGGSDPNDWNAFRQFAIGIRAPDPGPTPFSGWPDAFGGTVLSVASQQYE